MTEKEIERIKQALECCAQPIPNCEKCFFDNTDEGRRCYGLARLALDCIKWLKSANENYLNFYKTIYKEVFDDVFRCVKGSTSEDGYTEITLNNLRELAKMKYGVSNES